MGLFSKNKKNEVSVIQSEMTRGIQKLIDKDAMDVMTPRIDVISFEIEESLESVIQAIRKSGFSRYPVWENKVDNIVGILYAKDILYFISNKRDSPLADLKLDESLIRKPFFIPESKQLSSLLSTFQKHKVHIAIILDEYGGFSGIVTLEDIIEVIIGNVQDEHDREEDEISKISDNVYIVDGRTTLEELQEKLSISYTNYMKNVDSIGGLIYSVFERVPNTGERIEIDGITYQVLKQLKNKIISIKIWLPQKD